MDKILLTYQTSQREIFDELKRLRETKGKEVEVLKFIKDCLNLNHDTMVSLFWEEALTYQHLYMNDSKNKKALKSMQETVLFAKFYVEKFKLERHLSRVYRFLGRVADYTKDYKKAILHYKKAIKFVHLDPEPFRILELENFMVGSLIASGKIKVGYKKALDLYSEFLKSKTGIALKRRDYQTWGIWLSGLVIRTIDAMLSHKKIDNLAFFEKWLKEVEEMLTGDGFSYRKAEIKELWTKIESFRN
jgi:tetratricopeptide (TPR) repeat protein